MTSHTHYENYRTGKLTAMMKSGEVTDSMELPKKKHFLETQMLPSLECFPNRCNRIAKKNSLNCFAKQEEGNALTAVGDEIRSRNAAAKKEGKGETPVDKKVRPKI